MTFVKALAVPLTALGIVVAVMAWQGNLPQFGGAAPAAASLDPTIQQEVDRYMNQQCDFGRRRVGITSCEFAVVATSRGVGGEQFVVVQLDYTAPDGTPHSISWLFTFDNERKLQDVV